jgi:hypothetical protein
MKKLIKGMIMVLLAVFMLISNADASAWDVYGTVVDAPEGTVVGVWRADCGGQLLIGYATPNEAGNYELISVGKGEYLIYPLNDDGVTFDPEFRTTSIPQNKSLDFVVVE